MAANGQFIFKICHRLILIFACVFVLASCQRQAPLQGYLEGDYIYLASNVSGTLTKLWVTRGQQVRKDQLIYELDPEPELSALNSAKQTLLEAENKLKDLQSGQRSTILESILAQQQQAAADLNLSKITLDRYRALLASGAIAKERVDQAQADYQRNLNLVNQFKANLEEARLGARENAIREQLAVVASEKANVDKAQWQLDQKRITAPVAGLINDTFYLPGEFVNSQQPVAQLLGPQNIYAIFYIPEPLRSTLHMGQIVHFRCDHCRGRFAATVNYISAQAEYTPPVIFSRESRGKLVFRVQAALSKDVAKQFYPGQPVDIYLK